MNKQVKGAKAFIVKLLLGPLLALLFLVLMAVMLPLVAVVFVIALPLMPVYEREGKQWFERYTFDKHDKKDGDEHQER